MLPTSFDFLDWRQPIRVRYDRLDLCVQELDAIIPITC